MIVSAIIKQIRRLKYDDGQYDRDFSIDEMKLQKAEARLNRAVDEFSHAAQKLRDELLLEQKH